MSLHNSKSLCDQLPIWHFDGNLMVFKDGSLGAGLEITGKDIATSTNSNICLFTRELENLLKTISEGFKIQIFHNISKDVDSKIKEHEKLSLGHIGAYKEVTNARVSFLKDNFKKGNYYQPKIYIFIRGSKYKFKKTKLFGNCKDFEQIENDKFCEHKDEFLRTFDTLKNYLDSTELNLNQLSKEKWSKLVFEYFNFSRAERIGLPRLRSENLPLAPSLLSQLILTDLSCEEDCLRIDDHFFRVVNLKLLPESTFSSMSESIAKLPFHYWISQTIEINDQKKEIEKFQLQRRIAHSMAAGSKNVSDLESESKLQNLESLLDELINGSEKILTMSLSLIIWDKDKKHLQRKVDNVLREFKGLNQAEGVSETLTTFDSFIHSWPGACEIILGKKLKASNAAHLMPVFSYWQGNKKPVALLPNRDFTLFSLDYFDDELPNWNALTIGGSGAGKSYSVCSLALQFYGQTVVKNGKTIYPKIVFIDNGKSSENFVKACDGEFIDVSIDSNLCLNVFELSEGETKPSTLKVKSILAVLELILKDDEKSTLPKREKALLEEIIFKTYCAVKDRQPTLSDLKELLSVHELETMRAYSEILFSWTGNTAFGKILDGQSSISLTKNVTAIEIKELDSFPELKDVFMLIITNFVQREAESDLATPYMLICDEAHRLFKTSATRDYILYCYRVFRKYNCSINCITQNYKDFLSIPEVAEAIFPNTIHVFILRQRKIDWDDFQKVFGLNDAEISAVKSLQLVKNEYSEFFYMQDERRAILRLINDKLTHWVCTSSGSDKTKIEQTKKENPELSDIEVLKLLANLSLGQAVV
jgi:type IV secretory pathway VirB4 component